MKKTYEQPEMEIQNFEVVDVITDSNDLPEQPAVPNA
jgi:hypothetical protein